MAGIKGRVILKSVPDKLVETRVAEHLVELYRSVPPSIIISLVTGSKPLALVRDIPEEEGRKLVEALGELGASAFFLPELGLSASAGGDGCIRHQN